MIVGGGSLAAVMRWTDGISFHGGDSFEGWCRGGLILRPCSSGRGPLAVGEETAVRAWKGRGQIVAQSHFLSTTTSRLHSASPLTCHLPSPLALPPPSHPTCTPPPPLLTCTLHSALCTLHSALCTLLPPLTCTLLPSFTSLQHHDSDRLRLAVSNKQTRESQSAFCEMAPTQLHRNMPRGWERVQEGGNKRAPSRLGHPLSISFIHSFHSTQQKDPTTTLYGDN
ncbi:hypothetical protein B0O80DRAFT_238769 [Mortierella sp. GBAus27b]|nr:hypothetical protein B0O80DRAFT_238769 [Mortierella sp. GBAus27b]